MQLAIPMEDPIVLRRYITVTLPFYRYNNSIDVSADYFKNGFCYIMRQVIFELRSRKRLCSHICMGYHYYQDHNLMS